MNIACYGYLISVLVLGAVGTGCITGAYSAGPTRPIGLRTQSARILGRPAVLTPEIQMDTVEARASTTSVLGYTISGDNGFIVTNLSSGGYDDLTMAAIFKAVLAAKADSLQVTTISEEFVEAFYGLTKSRTVVVRGRPIRFVATVMSAEKFDELRLQRALAGDLAALGGFGDERECVISGLEVFFFPVAAAHAGYCGAKGKRITLDWVDSKW